LKTIVSNLYKNLSVPKLKLWGEALNHMEQTPEENIISVVTQEDFQKTHTKYEDLSGVIDYLNSVKGSNYTLLATEDGKGNIKGSLRTRKDDLNLSDMAGKYGGGGHKKASGFTVKGNLEKSSVYKVELPPIN
jgi:phosphoesterase RecJ-like protein